ncbi:hypothetical protein PsYK624_012640 [Phanerochaete sordida]|uniref:Uncharacterized protein n=1 Tax=Phanerochaete sordida TaxID=48140 RepID=A0A9P3FZ18_9APHY|nr:hypothetical protein PsYK624_012640 [Phanerochaete sordida]
MLIASSLKPTPTRYRKGKKSSHKHPNNFDAGGSSVAPKTSLSFTTSASSPTSKTTQRAANTKSISIDDDNDSDPDSNNNGGNSKNDAGGFTQKGGDYKDTGSSSDSDDGGNNGGNSGGNSGGSSTKGSDSSNNVIGGNNSNSDKFSPPVPSGFPCEVVNDNDGRLQYTGIWVLESKDPNGIYFTTHTTTSIGSEVSIAFNGTSITIVGIVHASNDTVPPAIASYTIDDDEPLTLPLPISTRDIPNQQFFESPNLPLTTHKLVINITSDGSPYTLDTLLICSKSTNPISAVLAPTPESIMSKDLPRILAGVLSGVAVLLMLILGFVLVHRRRRKSRANRTMNSPIRSWLQRQTLFTSSESILRNNPSNPSTVDPYDKLSSAEKAPPGTARAGLPDYAAKSDSGVLPASPASVLKRAPSSAASSRLSAVHRASDNSSWLLPVLSLEGESLSEELSDRLSQKGAESRPPSSTRFDGSRPTSLPSYPRPAARLATG